MQSGPKHCQSWGVDKIKANFFLHKSNSAHFYKNISSDLKDTQVSVAQKPSNPGNADSCQDLCLGYSAVNCLFPLFQENTTATEPILSATALGIPCLSPQLEFCISCNSLTSLRKRIFSTHISLQLCLSDWIKWLHFYTSTKLSSCDPYVAEPPRSLRKHPQAKLSSSCTTAFCFTVFFKEKKGTLTIQKQKL